MLVVGRWSHIRRRLLCQWSDFGRLRLGPAGVGPAALAGCPTCRAGDWGRPQPRQLESDLLAGAVPVAALRGACQCQWTCTWASHEGVHWQVRPTATLRRADRHGDVLSSHCKHAPALAWPPSTQRAEVRKAALHSYCNSLPGGWLLVGTMLGGALVPWCTRPVRVHEPRCVRDGALGVARSSLAAPTTHRVRIAARAGGTGSTYKCADSPPDSPSPAAGPRSSLHMSTRHHASSAA